MERTSPFPCRVYCPTTDQVGTAQGSESTGVLVLVDGAEEPVYFRPEQLVEVVDGDDSALQLIDGRVVLRGSVELEPGESATIHTEE